MHFIKIINPGKIETLHYLFGRFLSIYLFLQRYVCIYRTTVKGQRSLSNILIVHHHIVCEKVSLNQDCLGSEPIGPVSLHPSPVL